MWLTGEESGFHVVRFTNDVWPFRSAAGPTAPGPRVRPPAPAPTPAPLPATGLPWWTAAIGLAALGAAGYGVRRRLS